MADVLRIKLRNEQGELLHAQTEALLVEYEKAGFDVKSVKQALDILLDVKHSAGEMVYANKLSDLTGKKFLEGTMAYIKNEPANRRVYIYEEGQWHLFRASDIHIGRVVSNNEASINIPQATVLTSRMRQTNELKTITAQSSVIQLTDDPKQFISNLSTVTTFLLPVVNSAYTEFEISFYTPTNPVITIPGDYFEGDLDIQGNSFYTITFKYFNGIWTVKVTRFE